jgi:type IV secretory pathway VirB10-like protein
MRTTYLPPGGNKASDDEEDTPLATVSRHKKSTSSVSGMGNFGLGSRTTKPAPVILPPQPKQPQPQPQPPVRTFEELTERHKEKMRALQEPVTKNIEQEAELAAVKQRWERSKAVEREVMARREAEKRANSREPEGRTGNGGTYTRRHSRSQSGEILLATSGGVGETERTEDEQPDEGAGMAAIPG